MKAYVLRGFILVTMLFSMNSIVRSDDKKTPTPLPFPTMFKSTPESASKTESEGVKSKGSEAESKKTPTPIGTFVKGKEGGNGGDRTYPPVLLTSDYLRTINRGTTTILCGVEKVNGSIKGNANDNASCNLSKARWVPGGPRRRWKILESRQSSEETPASANGEWSIAR